MINFNRKTSVGVSIYGDDHASFNVGHTRESMSNVMLQVAEFLKWTNLHFIFGTDHYHLRDIKMRT